MDDKDVVEYAWEQAKEYERDKLILCHECWKRNHIKCPLEGLKVKSIGTCSAYEPLSKVK